MDTLKASKMKEKLVANEGQALMSKKLATIFTDAPIEVTFTELNYSGPNEEALIDVWQELGFKSLLEKVILRLRKKNVRHLTLTLYKRYNLSS